MDKNEKFGYVKLYTGHLSMPDYDPRALIGTAAVNTGMDNICLERVDRFGFPRCPSTLLQERGRNARMAGMSGAFTIYTNWIMFVKLVLSILATLNKEKYEPSECDGVNLVIPSKSPDRIVPVVRKQRMTCPLTRAQKERNRTMAHHDMIDVLNLSCLPGLGCIHCRSEWFMAMGHLSAPPEMMLPCETQ